MPPLVIITIPNWNGGDVVYNCVHSLYKITKYQNFKVIMVDNNSTDHSVDRIKRSLPQVQVIKSPVNLGYARGLNLAWYYAQKFRPDYICNMNNDIIITDPHWLSTMVKCLEKSPKRGIAGNKLISPDGRLQRLFIDRQIKDYEYQEYDTGKFEYERKCSGVGGALMLVKKSVIEAIGATDEHYFYAPDDIDYCKRAIKAGFTIMYEGRSKAQHIGSFSLKPATKDETFRHQAEGYMRFSLRWGTKGEALKMILRQAFRAFITTREPYVKKSLTNVYFHTSCIKRFYFYLVAVSCALQNYKEVDNRIFENGITNA